MRGKVYDLDEFKTADFIADDKRVIADRQTIQQNDNINGLEFEGEDLGFDLFRAIFQPALAVSDAPKTCKKPETI